MCAWGPQFTQSAPGGVIVGFLLGAVRLILAFVYRVYRVCLYFVNVSRLNNHHVEQRRTGTEFHLIVFCLQ